MSGTDFWGRFEHDPRHPQNAHLRAADRDRDAVSDLLGAAYADGRLDRDELDERSQRSSGAKTLGELPPLVADLVSTHATPVVRSGGELRAEAERRYGQQRRQALTAWLTPTLICWIIWVIASLPDLDAFPWPVFVMLGTGVRYVQLATHRAESIAGIEHGLQRRERKRLQNQQRAHQRALGHTPVAPFPPPPHPQSPGHPAPHRPPPQPPFPQGPPAPRG